MEEQQEIQQDILEKHIKDSIDRDIKKELEEYKIVLSELFREETSNINFFLLIGIAIIELINLLILIFKK